MVRSGHCIDPQIFSLHLNMRLFLNKSGELSLAKKVARGSLTGTTNPFIYTPVEGFKQPQTFEISIPCRLTEHSHEMKNPWNRGSLIYTLLAIFRGCYITSKKPFAGSSRRHAAPALPTNSAFKNKPWRLLGTEEASGAWQPPLDWPPETTLRSPRDHFQQRLWQWAASTLHLVRG